MNMYTCSYKLGEKNITFCLIDVGYLQLLIFLNPLLRLIKKTFYYREFQTFIKVDRENSVNACQPLNQCK